MRSISDLIALSAFVVSAAAISASAYMYGQSTDMQFLFAHTMNDVRAIEKRIEKIEVISEKVALGDRIKDLEKWARGRCLGLTVSKVCEDVQAVSRKK